MTISEAIEQLTQLRSQLGDIQVATDCSFCGRTTAPTRIVAGPPVVILTERKNTA